MAGLQALGFPQAGNLPTTTKQIGDIMVGIQPGGGLMKLADGSAWAEVGVLFPASSYPICAAQCDHLKVSGVATSMPASATVYSAATNGTVWVFATGDATNVYVLTIATGVWTTVSHNLGGGTARGVCYDASTGRIIVVGNTAASFFSSYTTGAGTSFTAGATSAITTGTADSCRVWANAGTVIVACAGATTGGAARSTNGATAWTAKNLNQAVVTVAAVAHNGNGVWLIAGTGSTAGVTSADDGVTFSTNATMPNPVTGLAGGNSVFIITAAASNYFTSPTGATSTWATRNFGQLGQGAVSAYAGNSVTWDGTYFRVIGNSSFPGQMLYGTDGISWQYRSTFGAGAVIGQIYANGGNMVVVGTGAILAVSLIKNWPTVDQVGYSTYFAPAGGGDTNGVYLFRIG